MTASKLIEVLQEHPDAEVVISYVDPGTQQSGYYRIVNWDPKSPYILVFNPADRRDNPHLAAEDGRANSGS